MTSAVDDNEMEKKKVTATEPIGADGIGDSEQLSPMPLPSKEEGGGEAADDTTSDAEKKKADAPPPPVPWGELFKFADTTDKWYYLFGTISAMIAGTGMPLFSLLFGQLLDELSRPALIGEQINKLALYMTIVGIGRFVFGFFAVSFFMVPCERMTGRIRGEFVRALLKQEMGYHDGVKPGAMMAHLVGDIQVFRNGTNDKLAMGILSFSMFVAGYILAFVRAPRIAGVAVAMMPIVMLIAIVWKHYAVKFITENRESYAKAGEVSDEAFQNFRTLQILGLEDQTIARFEKQLEAGRFPGVMTAAVQNIGMGCIFFTMFAAYSGVYSYAAILIRDGDRTIGDLGTVFFAVMIASFGLVQVMPTLGGLAEAAGAIAKVYAVLDREPKITAGDKKIPDEDFKGKIEFEGVDFVYPTKPDQQLFKGLSLTVEAGSRVAFAGASGCGKSSLIALVQRLYDPVEGRVLIDGVDLKELDIGWFRDNVGVVSQEPTLFSGTIADNVRFGKADATQEEIEQVCNMAAIHDTIDGLPDKYETDVGSIGSQLSGGQKQRIAIARALVRKPKILILDEATSALDRHSEVEVQKAIDNLLRENKFTVLVIAHRLATISTADKIHFIERDEAVGSDIVEAGTFRDLMAKGGHFFSMASRQAKSAARHGASALDAAAAAAVSAPDAHDDGGAMVAERHPSVEEIKNVSDALAKQMLDVDDAGKGNGASPTSPSPSQEGGSPSLPRTGTDLVAEAEKEKKDKEVLQVAVDEEIEHANSGLGRVASMMGGYKAAVFLAILGSLLNGGQMPFYAVVMTKSLAIMAQPSKIDSELLFWAPGMFLVVAGAALIGNLLQAFYAVAGERLTKEVRILTLRSILRQDATFFDMPGRDPGGLQGMLSGDCESVHQLFGPTLGPLLQLIATLGAGLGISFYYQPKVAAVVLSCVPVLVFAGAMRARFYQGFAAKMDDKNKMATVFGESCSNIRTVVAFNAQQRQVETFIDADADNIEEGIKVAYAGGLTMGFIQGTMTWVWCLGLWYGGQLIQKGEADFFEVLIGLMGLMMSAMTVGEAGGMLAKARDAALGAKRVFAVVDRIPNVDIDEGIDRSGHDAEKEEGAPIAAPVAPVSTKPKDNFTSESSDHSIDFVETDFTYPSRPKMPVLKRFSQKITSGKSYGLCGSTGCGKSTLIQLLCRFYDPTPDRDTIRVDDAPLPSLDLRNWRSHIAAVMQEPSLFSGSVRENILFGIPDASQVTQDEVERVATLAAVHDDIIAMDKGYDTEVGYKGRNLSGGQKQRIAIARALLRRADILLLDEATSALDNATEAKVIDGIAEVAKKHPMTIVSIAHRLSTIKGCDTILLLDRGVILEQGSHEELMAKKGEYKKRFDLFAHGSH